MVKRRDVLILALACMVMLALAACDGKSQDELSYTAPFEIGVTAGNFLPGTELQYVGLTPDNRAEVSIKGQRALKQKADSLSWEGEIGQGVWLELDLRVLWYDEATLHVGGTAQVTVSGIHSLADGLPQEAPLTLGNAPVAYTVKKGERIPGTLLTYQGKTDEGAQLGGTDDYPFRKGGDSIVWNGRIKDNVWLRLDVRLGVYTDATMAVAGLASLWIVP